MRVIERGGCILLLASCLACSDNTGGKRAEETASDAAAPDAALAADSGGFDRAAFEATGLGKYRGKAKPASHEQVGDEVHYTFDAKDGPVCIRGDQFAMATRDRGSDDLLIFLQGGGSCTTALCKATEKADPAIPAYGLMNENDDQNPVASWNVTYVPYCDGSLHLGDVDIPDMNRTQHGLRNLTASLEVSQATFPKPKRILLSGASAGGYGTIWATLLVRLLYPNAQLFVFNDAGIGINDPNNPSERTTYMGEWNALQFIPASCDECQSSPHITPWMKWNLQHDPSLRLGMFSSYEDAVISQTFLMIDPGVFKTALLSETENVVNAAPERAKRFLVSGNQHTVGDLHATQVNGLSVADWLNDMLQGDPAWDNVLQ